MLFPGLHVTPITWVLTRFPRKKLKLDQYLNGKEVLDIGTNIGAIPISVSQNFKKCLGVDHNTDAIQIACEVKNFEKLSKKIQGIGLKGQINSFPFI